MKNAKLPVLTLFFLSVAITAFGNISYTNQGGLNEGTTDISVSSPANAGDYQIVSLGASSDGAGLNQPMDRTLMENQGFTLIIVRGDGDKRAEVWFREHNGTPAHNSVTIPRNDHPEGTKDSAYSITTINGSGITLNPGTFTTASDYSGGHSTTSVPFSKPSGSGFTFVCFFFDDSVQVTNANGGDILFTTWGHGDGDGFATVLYQAGTSLPSNVGVITHDSGGRQWVTASFNAVVSTDSSTSTTLSFQNGSNGYDGTRDTYLRSASADTDHGSEATFNVDGDDAGGPMHGLIKFENIVGSSAIPANANVLSASLQINNSDGGNAANFHRMLASWTESSTWNSMNNGISANGSEALATADFSASGSTGVQTWNVTAAVQAWVNGASNEGWAILPTGTNGLDFISSEDSNSASRPILTVTFENPTEEPPAPDTALTLNLLQSPEGLSNATHVWIFNADGSQARQTSGGTTYTTEAQGLSGSLGAGASGTFTVTATAEYNFNPQTFGGDLTTSSQAWLYDGGNQNFGVSSPADSGIQIASSEAMVLTFDLSNLTLPAGRALQVDGFQVENGTTTTAGAQRISYLASETNTVQPLTGNAGEPNGLVGGNNVFQPVHQAVATGDQMAIWHDTSGAGGQKRFRGFRFSTAAAPSQTTGIPFASNWKYLDNGSDQGTGWRQPTFDDSAWNSGAGQLGYGDGDEATVLSSNQITYYFRNTFTVADPSAVISLTIDLLYDDGAIVYINGNEVHRTSLLPTGTVNYLTTTTSFSAENAQETITVNLESAGLVAGENTIAVEVHNHTTTSSDISFDLNLEVVDDGNSGSTPTDVTFFSYGSLWKYLDNGTDQGTAWRTPIFNDNAWPTGNGQLGYGDGDEATVIQSSPVTYYFRRTFSVTDPASLNSLSFDLLYDDGAIVYINGNEVHRTSTMPSGTVGFQTFTSSQSADNAQQTVNVNLATAGLVAGDNMIAVEVHNRSATSSDISFDLQLRGTILQEGITLLSNGNPVTVSGGGSEEQLFLINVPAGTGALNVILTGGSGNADLIGRYGQPPSQTNYDFISTNAGNEETLVWANPAGGAYYLLVRGITAFTGASLTASYEASSSTARYRIIWLNDPSTTATIAWDQTGSSNPVVYYGPTDHGAAWQSYPSQKTPDRTTNFRSMNNHFARLGGLQPDTAYYFVIKDDQGVSPRFWFKTAPNQPEHFTFVAGGDSRNNRTPRRNGNKMVAKLRPLFVAFTGDMINSDNSTEWVEWMNDWQDIITSDGRITPILPHRGNHETGGNSTLYNLFDITADNYYAVNFGGNLLRYYVLNSEMTEGGTQGSWLASDLQANHQYVTHLCAGYHKPMRPHTSGKSEGTGEYNAWAPLFYDYGMDLVIESDSHMMKRTHPVRPFTGSGSDEGFIRDDTNGTIYIGEGCWGAPLRTPNDSKNWTMAMDSFNGFDLVHVFPDRLEVYTVRIDSVAQVTPLQEGEQIALPAGIDLWAPSGGIRLIAGRRDGQSPLSYAQYQLNRWGNQPPASSLPNTGGNANGRTNFSNFAFGVGPDEPVRATFEVKEPHPEMTHNRAEFSGAKFRYRGSYNLKGWFDLTEGVDYRVGTSSNEDGTEAVGVELLDALVNGQDSLFINVEAVTD